MLSKNQTLQCLHVVNILTFENAFKAINHELQRELNSCYSHRADYLGQVSNVFNADYLGLVSNVQRSAV